MDGITGITSQVAHSISDSGMTMMDSVNTVLLGNQLDQFSELGNATVRMMEQSVTPYLGGNIDLHV